MKNFIISMLLAVMLTACGDSANVNFISIKVFNSQFQVSLETSSEQKIKKLKNLFNHKVQQYNLAPNFKYLLEFKTSKGTERWRYSTKGFAMKYSQDDQRIFALIDKDDFNRMLSIE